MRIKYAEFQLWPLGPSEWFGSHPFPLDFAEQFRIVTEPTTLCIETYNEDDTFEHTVWVGISVLRPGGDTFPLAIPA